MSGPLDPAVQARLALRFQGQAGFQTWLARQSGAPVSASKPTPVAPAASSRWSDEHGPVRVMGIVEGYVVARRKGATPFLLSTRDFTAAFRPRP